MAGRELQGYVDMDVTSKFTYYAEFIFISNVIRECLLTAYIHTNIIANTLCIIFFSEFKHNPILLKQIFHVTDL